VIRPRRLRGRRVGRAAPASHRFRQAGLVALYVPLRRNSTIQLGCNLPITRLLKICNPDLHIRAVVAACVVAERNARYGSMATDRVRPTRRASCPSQPVRLDPADARGSPDATSHWARRCTLACMAPSSRPAISALAIGAYGSSVNIAGLLLALTATRNSRRSCPPFWAVDAIANTRNLRNRWQDRPRNYLHNRRVAGRGICYHRLYTTEPPSPASCPA
jgi:hypothetical protein